VRQLIIAIAVLLPCVAFAHENHHWLQQPDWKAAYPPERVVVIPEGQTVAMPSGDIDLLMIEGTCVAPRNADLALTVKEIIVAPDGYLDMGTEADPVRGKIVVTFADGNFAESDTSEWGHGLLVFGTLSAVGVDKPIWSEGDGFEPITMNANSLKVMDQIFVDPENTITFTSQNPAGTRGHTIVTDEAECFVKNVSLVGLGRTKPEPLSSSNRVGRYPFHFHHSMGAKRHVENVYCDGLDYRTKWGIVVHGSSWTHIEGCVATRTGGAGFVTEDGSEVANTFRRNLSFDNKAVTKKFTTDVDEGFTGAGFWFKSMVQFIDDNVSIGNSIGFQSAVTAPDVRGVVEQGKPTSIPQQKFQSTPGGPMDGIVTKFQTNLSGKRNRFVANRVSGFDCWGSLPQEYTGEAPYWRLYALPCQWEESLFAWNGMEFGGQQVVHSFTQSCMMYTNCDFVCSSGTGLFNAIDYHRVLYVDGCMFDGMKVAAMTGRGGIFANNVFQTQIGIRASKETSQDWPFGLTVENNVSDGVPIEYVGTDRTLDDIPLHQVTLAAVYANIAKYRESIGVNDGTDSNAAEIERLRGEIATLEQQINTATARLADLRAQLMALELESQGN
jgi:hypothetical protein